MCKPYSFRIDRQVSPYLLSYISVKLMNSSYVFDYVASLNSSVKCIEGAFMNYVVYYERCSLPCDSGNVTPQSLQKTPRRFRLRQKSGENTRLSRHLMHHFQTSTELLSFTCISLCFHLLLRPLHFLKLRPLPREKSLL